MNNQNDLISIIIPTYNSEKYLRGCLDSVFAQTYKNIEIIIVDGDSIDKTNEIIQDYCKKYKNIYHLHSRKGVSRQRNAGLEFAKGNYIAFIDSDDYINPVYIEEMFSYLINNNLDIVAPFIALVYYENNKKKKEIKFEGKFVSLLSNNNFYMFGYNSFHHGPIKLYRRTTIGLKRFKEDLSYGEDSVFNQSLVKERSLNFGVSNKAIYNYRKEINTTPAKKRFSKCSLLYFQYLLKELKQNKENNENRIGLLQIIKGNYSVFYEACRCNHKIYIPFILIKVRFILAGNIKSKKEKIKLLFPRLTNLFKLLVKKTTKSSS